MIAIAPSDHADFRPRSGGRGWLALVVGLILMNAGIVSTTVYFAATDRSKGIEPDYYARALNYDEVIRQREDNRRLGWSSTIALHADTDGRRALLRVSLFDRDHKFISGARLSAVAFASLRSADRYTLRLAEDQQSYTAFVPLTAKGQWRVEITATFGTAKFTSEQDVALAIANPPEVTP